MEQPPALELRSVDASYGSLQVLFGVDLVVGAGARLALLGTNGAGKSTVLRVATGLLAPRDGTVFHRGADITGMPTDRRAATGVVLVPGGRATCPGLTVRENLELGGWHFGRDTAALDARITDALALFPSLVPRLATKAGALSGGEQQMMALARGLVADPDVLMIDELSLGLAPIVVGQVVDAVQEISARGVTILLVEQSLNVASAVCDEAAFLEKGAVRFRGPIGELADRGDLVRSVFFGTASVGG